MVYTLPWYTLIKTQMRKVLKDNERPWKREASSMSAKYFDLPQPAGLLLEKLG